MVNISRSSLFKELTPGQGAAEFFERVRKHRTVITIACLYLSTTLFIIIALEACGWLW